MWQAQVFTLYPEVFPGPLSKGMYGKAMSKDLWNLKVVNIRDAAEDKHKTVDDTPYGGGSGMLLKADVLAKSLDQNRIEGEKILYLSPKGKNLIKAMQKNWRPQNPYHLFVVILKELTREYYLQEIQKK